MKARWKLLGLAGAAGVAATGAVVARNRRPQSDYEPEELRDRLRERLQKVEAGEPDPEPVVPPKEWGGGAPGGAPPEGLHERRWRGLAPGYYGSRGVML